jgi:hypothetical protein
MSWLKPQKKLKANLPKKVYINELDDAVVSLENVLYSLKIGKKWNVHYVDRWKWCTKWANQLNTKMNERGEPIITTEIRKPTQKRN